MQLNNKELKSAAILQYEVARHLGRKQWINEFRQNSRCDLSDDWIDKNIPSLDGRKLQTSTKSASMYVAESSHDIRPRTDPNINIVRENAAEDKKEETPTTVTKGFDVAKSPEKPTRQNDLKVKVAHHISYAPNTQGTHTLYKKQY